MQKAAETSNIVPCSPHYMNVPDWETWKLIAVILMPGAGCRRVGKVVWS